MYIFLNVFLNKNKRMQMFLRCFGNAFMAH